MFIHDILVLTMNNNAENWEVKKQDRWPIWKEYEINIKAVWQKVVGSNWIIGVDLKNVDKR